MSSFNKVLSRLDVKGIQKELVENAQLYNLHPFRKDAKDSPHKEMDDIWVRFNDITPYLQKGSLAGIMDEHRSVWYPAAQLLPELVETVFDVMNLVHGEELGGVLVTKLPPHSSIAPHTDAGWHAEYYDKFYVSIKSPKGSKFCFEDGEIEAEDGDVYWFRNDVKHWVTNDTDEERITLVIAIRTDETRRRIEQESLQVKHTFSNGVYVREMKLVSGSKVDTHSHTYDHLSVLAQGSVIVSVDGVDTKYSAPQCLTIHANKVHSVLALEDSVWMCIHATEETNTEELDKVLVSKGEL